MRLIERGVGRAFLILGGLVLALLMGACATQSTAQIALPTATSGAIRLTTDRTSYSTTQPVGVMLRNTSGSTYYAITGHQGCTYLVLQVYITTKKAWQDASFCQQDVAPQSLAITGNQTEPFTLAPGSNQNHNAWAPGTYRVALAISTSPTGTTTMVYSNGFTFQ